MLWSLPGWHALAVLCFLMTGDDPRSKVVEVRNEMEGRPMILMLVPNGSRVKKGDLICELDTAALRDSLIDQEIRMKAAEASATNARLALKVFDLELAEAREAMDQRIQSAKDRIRVLNLDLKICNGTLANETILERSDSGRAQLAQARYNYPRLKAAIEKAELDLKVLKEVTGPQEANKKEAEQKRITADAQSKSAILAIERQRFDHLSNQIARAKIVAPISGQAVHANPENPRPNDVWIEEGAILRERQIIVRIYPEAS